MKLRPYQRAAIDAARAEWDRGRSNALVVLATGLGKTQIFCELGRELRAEGVGKTLVLAHRAELIQQAAARWRAVEPDAVVGVVQGAKAETWADVIVASVQSCYPDVVEDGRVVRRGRVHSLPLAQIGLVIVDEVHHVAAESYRAVLDTVRRANPRAVMLGVTATPYRADGRGLGDVFDSVAFRMGIGEGIEGGWLCPLRGVRVEVHVDLATVKTGKGGDFQDNALGSVLDAREVHDEIVRAWLEHVGPGSEAGGPAGRPTVAFTPTVETAEHLADAFAAAGVPAGWVSGSTPKAERAETLRRYAAGELRVLVNCAVLTEGWDAPLTSCVLLARPTKSVGMYAQMVGRGTRLAPGKADCIVLDVVGASALGLASLADLSSGREAKAPGIDPVEQPEPDADAPTLFPDEPRAVSIRGVSVYEVELLTGAVAWARIRGARIATLDVGHSVVIYPTPFGAVALAQHGGEQRVVAQGPERDVLRAAERYAEQHGKAAFLRPSDFMSRRPATERQQKALAALAARNFALDAQVASARPLTRAEVPDPATCSVPQAAYWITYLSARLGWAKARRAAA